MAGVRRGVSSRLVVPGLPPWSPASPLGLPGKDGEEGTEAEGQGEARCLVDSSVLRTKIRVRQAPAGAEDGAWKL